MKLKITLPWTLILLTALALTTSLPSRPAHAADEDQTRPGLNNDGKLDLTFRYRYELVDQNSFARDAHASTLRTRLAYRSPNFCNFGFLIEFDDVRSVDNDLYNSTRNGNTNWPVVADPEGTELNQALILYSGIENTVIRAGRQRITLDNHRFIGDVGWRQNDQTYDSLLLTNKSLPKITIEYAYIDNVNRVFGPDSGTPSAGFQSDSHVLNVKYEWTPNWNVTAYAYLLDLEDSPLLSSKTIGVRVHGRVAASDKISTSYTVEYARQENYGNNPNNYSADYILLEGALTIAGITGKLGYEVLEGNSVQAFQTPLATLHAFQGWADKFLATPTDGIEDFYISIATKIRGANISLIYHRFNPEVSGLSYGSEWNLMIKKPLAKRYSIIFKFAKYNAFGFSKDTEKLWIMANAKFGN